MCKYTGTVVGKDFVKTFYGNITENVPVKVLSSDFTCIFSPSLSTPDLGRDPLVTGKQAVEIKHTMKEPRSLTDPVSTTGHTRELHLRDFCWRQANGELGKLFPNHKNVYSYVY